MPKKAVPSYRNPPVIEVVWAVQFSKLPWLTAAHTGVYWQAIAKDYPKCEEQPPIDPKDEPEQLLQPRQVSLQLMAKPPLCRQWFISASGNEVIQLQGDGFCVNWRKVNPEDKYPRYEYMKKLFTDRWTEFCRFVEGQGGEPPQVNLLEMTYVNNIFKDEGWSEPKDIAKVFPAISFQGESDFLPAPATLGSGMVFDIQGSRGRLHVSCRHARQLEADSRELFRLELVSRGRPDGNSLEAILGWFSSAREWIVRGFADLTSREIQTKIWGRQQ